MDYKLIQSDMTSTFQNISDEECKDIKYNSLSDYFVRKIIISALGWVLKDKEASDRIKSWKIPLSMTAHTLFPKTSFI